MADYREFEHLLLGQWHDVLSMYGIDIPQMKGKNSVNHPCPLCGGDDRAHWREEEGRLALFCRNCAYESMKSPEQVIMEATGIDFPELCNNLAEFCNHQQPEDIKKAQNRAKSNPARNLPKDHKQDHELSLKLISQLKSVATHPILKRNSVEHPNNILCRDEKAIYMPMANENDSVVNIAKIDANLNVRFLAGGVSYASWHAIPVCYMRQTSGIAWCTNLIEGLHHYWKTGQETRITFGVYNTIFMINNGIANESDTFVCGYGEKELLGL